MARIVSAVSPDCDTYTHTSSRKMGVLRSRKSDASSTETGISVSSSKIERVCARAREEASQSRALRRERSSRRERGRTARHEWYEVPQATKMRRRQRRMTWR